MSDTSIPYSENKNIRYIHGHEDAVLRAHRWRTVANSATYLVPHLTGGVSLLDVGCGPGTLTVDLARRVSPGHVVGIDLDATVIAEAARHAEDLDVAVTFTVGDIATAGGVREPFDVVHAHQVLQHVGNPVQTLRQMMACARPGGLVSARDADYPAMTWWPESPALDQWLELYLAVAVRHGANPNAGRRLPSWATEAGLTDIVYSTSTWTFSSPDDVVWWSSLWADRTSSTHLGRSAIEFGLATQDQLNEIAAGWRAWGRQPNAMFVVLHGEILGRTARREGPGSLV